MSMPLRLACVGGGIGRAYERHPKPVLDRPAESAEDDFIATTR
jgi:hypothetical protein